MNNLKTVILLVIVFVLAVGGIYYLYQTQVKDNSNNLLPYPSPATTFQDLVSPTPAPSPSPVSATQVPNQQPAAGSNTIEVKNEGIKVTSPEGSQKITSPTTISGLANVFEGKVQIEIKDANGNILGSNSAIACMGYDACPFETTITFKKPQTAAGIVEVYNPSGFDGSPKYLQTILVRF